MEVGCAAWIALRAFAGMVVDWMRPSIAGTSWWVVTTELMVPQL